MRNRKEYPDNWYDEIRPNVLKRDSLRCVKCSIRQRQWVAKKKGLGIEKIDTDEITDYKENGYKVYRIYLHVCHIDNNKSNCDLNNLITLCVSCHAKQDGNYKGLIRKGCKVNNQLNIVDEIEKLSHPPSLPSVARSVSSPLTGL